MILLQENKLFVKLVARYKYDVGETYKINVENEYFDCIKYFNGYNYTFIHFEYNKKLFSFEAPKTEEFINDLYDGTSYIKMCQKTNRMIYILLKSLYKTL